MTVDQRKTYESYHFGFSFELTYQHFQHLIKLFQTPSKMSNSILGGRSSVLIDEMNKIGPVAVKYYHRGGIVRHFIKKRYLKWGKTRGQKEYELLQKVRNIGISAPEPIAFAYFGRIFYQAWLVTREIKCHQTLAELSLSNKKRALLTMKHVIQQTAILIENRILHVDLHPGNVIVDNQDRVYILDFDKGSIFSGNKNVLKSRYIRRWNRAIKKHRLPKMLIELMYNGLNHKINHR
ncbi:MAG: lipopolysaccharide kinase InaA family protein [Thermodesulfobacteriota bacterium]|nr:lipopolysaccharide kinase InaA family protein [Thermodesulfobacteriota bacterium]